ncbi:hypothetical protein EDD17DRAFT_695396 [Pisolithus thermaeus]|nr:hypothetical protein EDD17DRAFT_695396 [Pisolithus thermaeus]
MCQACRGSVTHTDVHMILGPMTATTLVTPLLTTATVGVVMVTTKAPATIIEEDTVSTIGGVASMTVDTVTTNVVVATMT